MSPHNVKKLRKCGGAVHAGRSPGKEKPKEMDSFDLTAVKPNNLRRFLALLLWSSELLCLLTIHVRLFIEYMNMSIIPLLHRQAGTEEKVNWR